MNIEQLLALSEKRMKEIALEIESIDVQAEGAEARMDALVAEHEAEVEKRDRYAKALNIAATTPVNIQRSVGITELGGRGLNETDDPRGSLEYRKAFMNYVVKGIRSEILEKRADEQILTSDASAVIPSTIQNRIITKLENYGGIYAKITKLNVKGGMSFPISSFNPEAKWVTEGEVTETKKAEAKSNVTFLYYLLESRVAMGIVASVTTLDAFENLIVEKLVGSIIKAIENAVFGGTGTGQPSGILTETRIPSAQKIAVDATALDYKGWIKNIGKLPIEYRSNPSNEWYMAQSTFDDYIAGLTDANGQPVARTNYGIDGKIIYRFLGYNVNIRPESQIKSYQTAADGEAFVLFGDISEWALNSNMVITYEKYRNRDTNQIIDLVQTIADGKTLDANAFLVLTKKAK